MLMTSNQKYLLYFIFLLLLGLWVPLVTFHLPRLQYNDKNNNSKNRIQIIYFSHIRKEKWKDIIIPQMQGLIDCGLLSKADLLVSLSGDRKIVQFVELVIRDIFKNQSTSYISFKHTYENLYEYPGIKALHENGRLYPDKIFLYFHSKGMWFGGEQYQDGRTILEKNLYDSVVINWKHALLVFDTKSDVSKICFGGANGGWCWFNFYWVRGTYIKTCPPPKIQKENRYYFEGYLGNVGCRRSYPYNQTYDAYEYNFKNGLPNATYMGMYNIAANNTIPFFFPGDITDHLKNIKLT